MIRGPWTVENLLCGNCGRHLVRWQWAGGFHILRCRVQSMIADTWRRGGTGRVEAVAAVPLVALAFLVRFLIVAPVLLVAAVPALLGSRHDRR